MSNEPFYHKKSHLKVGMRCIAGILDKAGGIVRCRDMDDAKIKMLKEMRKPERLGVADHLQLERMHASIEVGTSKGFFAYSKAFGTIELTRKGRRELKAYRRKHICQSVAPEKMRKRKKTSRLPVHRAAMA